MMRALGLAVFIAMVLNPAFAAQFPKACKGDSRVRCVAYDPYEVVTIKAMYGYQTFILFGRGEKVLDLGGGDTTAWDIGLTSARDGIFIKPKEHKPATNITVITTKRHYNFDFEVFDFKNAEKRTYMVWFSYPEEEKAKAEAMAGPKETVAEILKFASAKKPKNEDYWAEGSVEFTPIAAWDDGEFTYLRFAPNAPFPAVYMVNDDGSETLLNKHVPEPNTIALQAVGKKFVLRRGEIFTCIFNESYDPYGVENHTRTVSPKVMRSLRSDVESDEKVISERQVKQYVPPAASEMSPHRSTRDPLPTVDLSDEVRKSQRGRDQ